MCIKRGVLESITAKAILWHHWSINASESETRECLLIHGFPLTHATIREEFAPIDEEYWEDCLQHVEAYPYGL